MARPNPDPSVFLDSSPRTNLSTISFGSNLISSAAMFFIITSTLSSCSMISKYTLLLGIAYFVAFIMIFSNALKVRWLSN